MIAETKKILSDDTLRITATTVRVPVFNSHAESINVEFKTPVTLDGVKEALSAAKGVVIVDDHTSAVYPTPLDASGYDDVFVGRLRLDDSVENGLNMWVVSDNIRKGAATNAIQIVEALIAGQV